MFVGGHGHTVLWLPHGPADIGWDAAHRMVAVPFTSKDSVAFYRLP